MLQTIAEAHGASPRQVALAFLTREPAVFAIPKASSAEHAADNAAAGELVLGADEIAALDKAFPRGTETAQPADAVAHTVSDEVFQRGDDELPRRAARRSRISAACFRTLSVRRRLSFFSGSPDSIDFRARVLP